MDIAESLYYNRSVNKIVPVLCLISALVSAAAATLGLVTVGVTTAVSALAVVSVPTAIIGTVLSATAAAFGFLFRRDRLCRIALYISLGALGVSVVSIIIWICM